MNDLPDEKSFRQMREVADSIPPQHTPLSRKALAVFKEGYKRLEQARQRNGRSS